MRHLPLRHDKGFELVVVDLAKDPLAAGPLARSTTRNSSLDKAVAELMRIRMPAMGRMDPHGESETFAIRPKGPRQVGLRQRLRKRRPHDKLP